MSAALSGIRKMMRYTAWANVKVFDAVAALPPGAAEAKTSGAAGSVMRTLNHVLVIDRIWQANLEGRAHGFEARNTPEHPPLAQMREEQAGMDAWYVAYAASLDAARHDEVVRFTFVGGAPGAMTRGEILQHVANHKTHHRGQVANMISAAGGKAPTMDLTVFARDVEPH